MKIRGLAAVAVVASAALAGSSGAAPKACNLVTDAKGDAVNNGLLGGDLASVPPAPNEAAFDIVSADLATDAKLLTAVIRVDKASPTATTAPTGMAWRVDWMVGETKLWASVTNDPRNGLKGFYGYIDPVTGGGKFLGSDAKAIIDTAKNEVRVTVPLAAYSTQASLKKGTKVHTITSRSGRFANAENSATLNFGNDTAEGKLGYVLGAKSCVAVGK